MCRRLICLVSLAFALGLVFAGASNAADPGLVGCWKFDESSGTTATDSSGNGNDGTLVLAGSAISSAWVSGKYDSALSFDGVDDYVQLTEQPPITNGFTFSAWVKRNGDSPATQEVFNNHQFFLRTMPENENSDNPFETFVNLSDGSVEPRANSNVASTIGQWFFVTVTWDKTTLKIYVNGELNGSSTRSGELTSTTVEARIGRGEQTNVNANPFNGLIDEVAFFDVVLEAEDIEAIMNNGLAGIIPGQPFALRSSPDNEATDVLRDADLSWSAGVYAATHDVYLGESFEEVDTATVPTDPGLTVTSYDPGRLELGKTYYWRVDEVNAAPDKTVFKGKVWSFTVEPVAIPIENITATASGANPTMGPEKTIDGSGLNELGQHSSLPADMWLTLTADSWIQYEFDQAYKLSDMQVWNSNQAIETFIGFGVKDALVETSLDGEIWTTVEGVGPFGQGTAQATYEANTTVDLSGIVAKYVKITPQNAHGITGQSGLSEVRFSRIPTEPREFLPVDGSTSARVDVGLSWRGGREAAAHELYLGSDPADLALAATTGDPSFVAEGLDYGQTYYWQVIEVNEAETPARYAGDILSFSTAAYAVVDDFESYSGEEGQEIFMTWFDGFGGDASLGGSTTGHIDGPFVETSIVNNGKQSMPVYVDNDGGFFNIDGKMSSPTFSEVVRDLDGQDWTASGIKTLSIMFAGSTGLTGQLYCKIGSTKLLYDGDTTNLGIGAWQAWNIDLSTVGGNLTNVRELAIGVEGGTSGILYLDDIRLYTRPGEFVTPVQPDIANLVAYYPFDGDLQDAAGSHHGTIDSGTPVFVDGAQGQAIEFIGNQQVIVAYADDLALNSFTLSTWINVSNIDGNRGILSTRFNGDQTFDLKVDANRIHGDVGSGTAWLNTSVDLSTQLHTGTWYHIAYVIDEANSTARIYLNGVLAETLAISGTPLFMKVGQELHIGNSYGVVEYMHGTLDEVALYNRALSSSEIAGLAGMTKQTHKPF